MIQRSHFVILVIQVKGSRSLLQTRFSLFVIAQILLRGTTTTYNLAGNSSRGLGAIKSSKSQRWFKGPSFLSQSEDHRPKQISAEVNEGDLEVKPAVSVNVTTIKQDLILQLKGRMSNWEKNEEVAAHILKLKTQLSQKIKQRRAILTSNRESTGTLLIDVELL